MTEKDHAQLTLLATGGLSRWQAARLRKRLAQEPELAQAWDATQALHQQLQQVALPASTPAPPNWPSAKSSRSRMPFVFRPITFAYLCAGFVAVYLPVSYLWVRHMKQEDLKEKARALAAQRDREQLATNRAREETYSLKTLPRLMYIGMPRGAKRRHPFYILEEYNLKGQVAWKLIGKAQVTVHYASGETMQLTPRLPETTEARQFGQRFYVNFPSPTQPPHLLWSRGQRMPDGSLVWGDQWRKVAGSGHFVGFGTHIIKDKNGAVLVTLEVKPVK